MIFISPLAQAAPLHWETDYAKALGEAKARNKEVLINFTGSDWCPICMAMDKAVFQKQEFADYAAKNLILVMVDFPQEKVLPKQVADQNLRLQDEYHIEGEPTFILLDKDGRVVGRHLGGVEGGPAGFIAMLNGKMQ